MSDATEALEANFGGRWEFCPTCSNEEVQHVWHRVDAPCDSPARPSEGEK